MEHVISDRTKRKAAKRRVLVYPARAKSLWKIEIYSDSGLFLSFAGKKGEEYESKKEFKEKYKEEIGKRKSQRWWEFKLFF